MIAARRDVVGIFIMSFSEVPRLKICHPLYIAAEEVCAIDFFVLTLEQFILYYLSNENVDTENPM